MREPLPCMVHGAFGATLLYALPAPNRHAYGTCCNACSSVHHVSSCIDVTAAQSCLPAWCIGQSSTRCCCCRAGIVVQPHNAGLRVWTGGDESRRSSYTQCTAPVLIPAHNTIWAAQSPTVSLLSSKDFPLASLARWHLELHELEQSLRLHVQLAQQVGMMNFMWHSLCSGASTLRSTSSCSI